MSNFTEEEKRWLLERVGWRKSTATSREIWSHADFGQGMGIVYYMPDPSTDAETVLTLFEDCAQEWFGDQWLDFGTSVQSGTPLGEAVCRAALQLRESE